MRILRDLSFESLSVLPPEEFRGGVLCIGNFDGVHVGHMQMFATGLQIARSQSRPLLAMTFDPHPAMLLFKKQPRPPLTTLEQRLELIKAAGVDLCIVQHVTEEYLQVTAEAFLAHTLRDTLGIRHIVEGENFTFGSKALGDVDMLSRVGTQYGFETTIVPTVERALMDATFVGVSSTLTRFLVSNGRVADAAICLGKPFTLRGPVVHGFQRGRKIGFPTANVATSQILPAPGVYAGRAKTKYGTFSAAISIGTNPTFAGEQLTIEAYLLDFNQDLYGQTIDVEFHRWLRDQRTFSGVESLIRQLHHDVAAARELMSSASQSFLSSSSLSIKGSA